jgi:hypothetical protein
LVLVLVLVVLVVVLVLRGEVRGKGLVLLVGRRDVLVQLVVRQCILALSLQVMQVQGRRARGGVEVVAQVEV